MYRRRLCRTRFFLNRRATTMSPPLPSSTQSIHALNRSFLLVARELARDDLAGAALSMGMETATLQALANAPLHTVEALSHTPACLFSLRFPGTVLQDFIDANENQPNDVTVDVAQLRLMSTLLSSHAGPKAGKPASAAKRLVVAR